MGLGDDIRDYLTTQGFSPGASKVFIGLEPALPIVAVTVTETGGAGPTHLMGHTPPGAAVLERPRFQVRVRAEFYTSGEALVHEANSLLDGMAERTINGRRYYRIEAVQTPFFLGQDENERPLFACNYDCLRAVTT